MVGGGNKKDNGSFTVANTNVFAALETLKKKKKSDKGSSKGSKTKTGAGKSKATEEDKPPVFWAPAPLTAKSWADVEDEDDDDYYATTAPPQAVWGGSGLSRVDEGQKHAEESEDEDELINDYVVEDEHEHEHEHEEPDEKEQPEPILKKHVEVVPAHKEAERQLSKKERKKKELEELDAILADLGVNPKDKTEDEQPSDPSKGNIEGKSNGDAEKKDDVPTESKTAKKKKKKDKALKEAKEAQDHPSSSDVVSNGQGENSGTEVVEEDASTIDVKERLKKVAAAKKKKSGKDLDGAAKAAATEAAARSAKLAAAKKKEKKSYNQQPTR